MLIGPHNARRFIDAYKIVLLERHRIAGLKTHQDELKNLVASRSYLKANPQSLETAIGTLAAAGVENGSGHKACPEVPAY